MEKLKTSGRKRAVALEAPVPGRKLAQQARGTWTHQPDCNHQTSIRTPNTRYLHRKTTSYTVYG